MIVRKGKEMRRYLVSVTALVVLLLMAVMLYTTIDSIRRINREMDKEKTRVTEQLVDYFSTTLQALSVTGQDTEIMKSVFREDLVGTKDMSKQLILLNFLTEMERSQFGADYLTYVSNGSIVSKSVDPALEITDFQTSMPNEEKNYVILDELGGREGYFISVYVPAPLAGIGEEFMNFAVDRTDQMTALEQEYSDEKSSLIARQITIGVIILVLGGLISALGVYYLTRRDITGPIEEIARISDQIVEGTFKGEIEVNPDSDFSSLQVLLSSGKQILDKMGDIQE
jgi:HAMP domain-containing protein